MPYLNNDFAPLRNPIDERIDFESYNSRWFDDKPASRPPIFIDDDTIPQVSGISAKSIPYVDPESASNNSDGVSDSTVAAPKVTVADENKISPSVSTVTDSQATDPCSAPSDLSYPARLRQQILTSRDKLLFISYTPTDTMRPRWFLVQVDLSQSTESENSGIYFCTFLQRHPRDDGKSDNMDRW